MARSCRLCGPCAVAALALLVGLALLDTGERIPPLFVGDLLKHEEEYQGFVRATLAALRSKRVWGPALVHEVAGHAWLEQGLVLDIGVFLGSSTRVLAGLLGNRTTVHGFDTFSGFPEGKVWYIDDFEYPTKFGLNETWVRTLIQANGVEIVDGKPASMGFNVEYHRGLTFDTLPKVLDAHPGKPVTFVHVDIDTYEGAIHALETCRKRFVPGTVIVFDDFFVLSGEFKALYEWQRKYAVEYTLTSWGHDIGIMNVNGLRAALAFAFGWNFFPLKVFQMIMGLKHCASWQDYLFTLAGHTNNAVGLRITGLGRLHEG